MLLALKNLPIRRKLSLVILVTSLTVLLLVCVAIVGFELISFRKAVVDDMTVLADVLGRNSTALLSSPMDEDVKPANDLLSALSAERAVVAACLFKSLGEDTAPVGQGSGAPRASQYKRFGEYVRSDALGDFPPAPPAEPHRFDGGYLHISKPVMLDGEVVGHIYLRADLERMDERLRSYALIVVVVALVAVIVALSLSRWLQRLIASPILALADTARIISEKKDYSLRAQKLGQDEIGQLTDAVNAMLTEIESGQRAVQDANASLEARTRQLEEANQSLEAQATQLIDSIGVLGAASRDILALSTQLASSASETVAAVTETSTTVQEVKHTASVSSQRTRHVSENAQKVAKISKTGQESTELTIAGMSRIREQMQSIAQSMLGLSEQTQTIGGIIASVDDLAQQSNLLAVNAAIEAAKAGEQGRGFAVVAQEIKNLAEQSRQATMQVRTILSDVQKSTNAAVMATEQGTKAVEAGVQQSEEAGRSIVTLSSSIGEAAQAAVQIAASSQQQLAGMDQVAQAMESIRQGSAQNATSAKQLEAAAQNLGELGQRLQELVARYKPLTDHKAKVQGDTGGSADRRAKSGSAEISKGARGKD